MDVRLPRRPLTDGVVTLRSWRPDDAAAIVAAFADPEIVYWLHQAPQPYREQDALAYVRAMAAAWRAGSGGAFAIVETGGDEAVGSIGLSVVDADLGIVEIGYWVAPAVRGRGVTTRALDLLSKWLLESVGAARLQIRADVHNAASLRVAEKAGFVREGTLRSSGYSQRANRRIDYAIFSLLPTDLV
jgi:RimJ/RimL family protein N-acetyltransferase